MVIAREWFQTIHDKLKVPKQNTRKRSGERAKLTPTHSGMIHTLFLRQRKLSDMSCPVPFSLDSVHNESREAKACTASEYYISDVIVTRK
jgi:hypothetical protein